MDYPLINGLRYSWASVAIKLDSANQLGIKEISYSHSVDRGEVRGVGPQVIGHTRGEYKAEGSITFLKEEYDAFVAKNGDGYMEKVFDISVSYAEIGNATVTDQLVGCRLSKAEKSPSAGTDALEVSCDLTILYLIENGKKPLVNMKT